MGRRARVAALVIASLFLGACGSSGGPDDAAPGTTAASTVAPVPHRTLKMIWGPNDLPDGSSAFPAYRHLGVDVLQTQLNWRDTAPTRPAAPRDPSSAAYRWPVALSTTIERARRVGIQVAVMVRATPGWANGARGQAQAPDRDKDFADFLHAAARKYPSVRHWMIWGEPTRAGNFAPMPRNSPVGPRRYATLLDAAYGALKAESPENVVIGGMTWTLGEVTPVDFVRWLRVPDGRPPRMDLYGHNPYATRFPDIDKAPYYPGLRDISDIDTLHGELERAYRGRPGGPPGLWLSEFSVASNRDNRAFATHVSRADQARWLTAAYRLAERLPYVAGLGWFNLFDEDPAVPRALTNGLLDAQGRPKPAYAAYAAVGR